VTKTPDFGLRRRKAAEFALARLRDAENALPKRFLAGGNIFDHVGLHDIGPQMLEEWSRRWRVDPYLRDQLEGGWDWGKIHENARRSELNHFAVSGSLDGSLLFMLCIGRLTHSSLVIRYLERIPSMPRDFSDRFGPMKGLAATCAFAAAEAYARINDRSELVLDQPLPGVVSCYESRHDFNWAPGSSGQRVLSRRISP
jgi:hypothetical protein